MRKTRFTESQIVKILKAVEGSLKFVLWKSEKDMRFKYPSSKHQIFRWVK